MTAVLHRHPNANAGVERLIALAEARELPARKKQTTRLIKCKCDECGFTFRATRQWTGDPGVAMLRCPDPECSGFVLVG